MKKVWEHLRTLRDKETVGEGDREIPITDSHFRDIGIIDRARTVYNS